MSTLAITGLFFLAIAMGVGLSEVRYQRALRLWRKKIEAAELKAVKMDTRSQSAYRAKYQASAAEKFAPWLPDFPLLPREVKLLGDPIDMVGFKNLGDESDDPKPIILYFIEIKTGSSTLSRDQLRIRDAVQKKRLVWVEYRPNLEGPLE